MPNRVLKETWLTSETIDALSPEGEVLAARLLDYLDDYGWGKANPRLVLAGCFPLKVGRIEPVKVAAWIDELAAKGLIELWDNHGTPWMHWVRWREHVTPRAHRSKCPLEYERNGAARVSTCTQMFADARTCVQVLPDSVPVSEPDPEPDPEIASGAPAGAPGAPSLQLSPPEGSNGTHRKGRRERRPPNPDVARLVLHYSAEFKRLKGTKPLIEAADGVAAARVLAGRSLEDAKGLVTKFLESPDEWSLERGLLRLRDLPAAVTKILAMGAGAGGNGRRAAQHAGLDEERRAQFAAMDRELAERGVIGETDASG